MNLEAGSVRKTRDATLKRVLFFCGFFGVVLFSICPSSYGEEFKAFAKISWGETAQPSASKNLCEVIKPKSLGDYSNFDPIIAERISTIIAGIRDENVTNLLPLFHPRLKITPTELRSVFSTWLAVYGKKQTKSIYRLFALKHGEESAEQTPCFTDQVAILPQYGYPYQLGLLVQILGEKELGRLYITLVPYKKNWFIGAFHSWQWTHTGKDYNAWITEAGKDSREKHNELAFLKLDLAAKLLDGHPHVTFADQVRVKNLRDETLKAEDLLEILKADIKDHDVVEFSSSLAEGGLGLLVRIRLKKEESARSLFTDCENIQKSLYKLKPWFQKTEGVFCSYLLPREPIGSDGKLGGMFIKNNQK